MNSTDFRKGLLLGTCCGLAVALVAGLLLSGSGGDEPLPREIQQLRQRLQQEEERRRRTAADLKEFERLAEQMTTRFRELEGRFEALSRHCREATEVPTPSPTRSTL